LLDPGAAGAMLSGLYDRSNGAIRKNAEALEFMGKSFSDVAHEGNSVDDAMRAGTCVGQAAGASARVNTGSFPFQVLCYNL
jgi:hypothetical protein